MLSDNVFSRKLDLLLSEIGNGMTATAKLNSALDQMPEADDLEDQEDYRWNDRVELGAPMTREESFFDIEEEDEDWNEYHAWLDRVNSYPADF